ncbi:hypothetical protein KR009_005411 [Drosophila setifemur]|nr:hypothetical protein KR009_005411 [Drosophila setifemur]
MKYFVICALAALLLFQAATAFKVKRIVYVVPATTTTAAPATNSSTTTTTAAPAVHIVYCSWKNNWCRPASSSIRNCKWGLCKFSG